MKKEVIRVLSSLIIAIFLVYIFVSANEVFGLELIQDYTADAGPFDGERYYPEMIAHSAYWCDAHGKPFFRKRQTEVILSGAVNGEAFSKNVTNPPSGKFTIWSHGHPSCSGSTYSLKLESKTFSGMSSATVRGYCDPLVATGAGAEVKATGKTNFVLTESKEAKNNHEAYLLAEANANLPGLAPKNSPPNIAWWNKEQAATYTPDTSYTPTKTAEGTEFDPSNGDDIKKQIGDIEKRIQDYIDQMNREIANQNNRIENLERQKQNIIDNELNPLLEERAELEAENETLENEIKELEDKIKELEDKAKELKEVTIPGLKESIQELENTISQLESEISYLEDITIPPLQENVDKINNEINKINSDIANLDSYINDLEPRIPEFEQTIQECNVNIDNLNNQLDDLLSQWPRNQQKIQEVRDKIASEEIRRNNAQGRIDQYNEKKEQKIQKEQDLADAQTRLADAEKVLNEAKDSFDKARDNLNTTKEELSKAQEELTKAEDEFKKINEEDLPNARNQIDEKRDKYDENSRRIIELNSQIDYCQYRIDNIQRQIDNAKNYIEQLKGAIDNAEDAKINNESLKGLRELQKILLESSDVIGDEEGYSSATAEGLLKEAAIFNAMHNGDGGIKDDYKGTIEDKTVQEDVKVEYYADKQQYVVGPFNIKYMEVYAFENQFAGITGVPELKLNIDGSEVVKELGDGWAFGWKEERKTVGTLGDEVPEKFDVYPHTEEDFYLIIDYEDGLNKITGFHLDFRYLIAEAKYEHYDGIIEIWKWKVGTPEFETCGYDLSEHKKDEAGNCTDECDHKSCTNYIAATVSVSKSKAGEGEIQACMRVVEAKRKYEEEEMEFVWDIDLTTTLAGDVWLDIESQKANLFSANGLWEGGERGLDNIGVTVYLYQGTTKLRKALFHDESGAQLSWPLYTAGGHYEVNRLEAPGGAANCFYVVEFEYDGQVLKSTVYMSNGGGEGSAGAYSSSPDSYSKSSMAVEEVVNRANLDASFGEITGDFSTSTGITHTTGLDGNGAGGSGSLEYSTGSSGEMMESKLQSPFRSNSSSIGTRYNIVASTYYNNTDTLGVSVNQEQFRIKYPVEGTYYVLNAVNKGTQRYIAEYMLHINLGLIERTETDISVLKDLYKVTVVVNEQKMTKEFNPYGKITNYEDFLIKLENTRVDGGYTLGLYSSDVGYQSYQRYCNAIKAVQDIKDGTELKVYATYIIRVYNNSDTMDVEINEITDYFDKTFTLISNDTYTSIINDDTKRDKTLVAEKPYYRICSLDSPKDWKPTRTENLNGMEVTVNGHSAKGDLEWNDISSVNGEFYSSKSSSLTNIKLDNSEYAEIFTTYEIDRKGYSEITGSGNVGKVAISTRNALVGDKYNIAELSNYSTYYSEKDINAGYYTPYVEGRVSGRVDRDSAPNNIDKGDLKNASKYEDDTFNANTLKVRIATYEREMYGYVWEDEKTEDVGSYDLKVGNGYKDSGEKLVPNVEVSLYEVINLGEVNASGSYDATYDGLEYYYKVPNQFYNLPKTESTGVNGENNVTLTLNEKAKDIDGNDVEGNYYLYGFLAGDYITRFDYGKRADSTATIYEERYKTAEEKDIIKYNGQDYENTRFLAELTTENKALNTKYLDLTQNTKINGTDINDLQISKARDNESRRMVVNSYSRNIENDRGEILRDRLADNTEYIESTQMFAETPIMSIEVDDPQTMRKTQTPGSKMRPQTTLRPTAYAPYNEKTDPNENQYLGYRYTIKNVNFGLEKRAETDIKLEKYVDTIMLTKADEIIFAAYMDEDGKVITEHANTKALDKLTYISHSDAITAGLVQQGFYAIAVEDDYMDDLSLLIKYKMKVINNSEVDFTGRLNDYYLSKDMIKSANGSPTVDLYKLITGSIDDNIDDNINLGELDDRGISTNSTLAEILSWNQVWNPDNTDQSTLAKLLNLDDLTPDGSIDQTDTLRPEVIVYGRYVGRFYYENKIGNQETPYEIKNYVKKIDVDDLTVTYETDKVVRTTVDQLVDYIDVNTSLDEFESGIGIENASWSLADTYVEEDGTITSLRNIISDSAYRLPSTVSGESVVKSIYDEKDRKLIRDSSSNIAISHNERLERNPENNRMKYIDTVGNRVQSMFNSGMTFELKPARYNPDNPKESIGTIYIITRKNTSSGQDANEMKMDNLAEILVYSNSTGRRDINSVPGNAMAIAKYDGFWKAGYNSIDLARDDDVNEVSVDNWTLYPENDAWSPEYVTIIAPTGIGRLTLIRNNIMQIAGLVIVLIGFITIFTVKQFKIRKNQDN